MTDERLAFIIDFLEGVYNITFSEKQIKAWSKMFSSYGDDEEGGGDGGVYLAAREWVRNGNHYPPSPADICKTIREINEWVRGYMKGSEAV